MRVSTPAWKMRHILFSFPRIMLLIRPTQQVRAKLRLAEDAQETRYSGQQHSTVDLQRRHAEEVRKARADLWEMQEELQASHKAELAARSEADRFAAEAEALYLELKLEARSSPIEGGNCVSRAGIVESPGHRLEERV